MTVDFSEFDGRAHIDECDLLAALAKLGQLARIYRENAPDLLTIVTDIASLRETNDSTSCPVSWPPNPVSLLQGHRVILHHFRAPVNSVFSFVPLPAKLMLMLIGLTMLYVVVAELAKKYF